MNTHNIEVKRSCQLKSFSLITCKLLIIKKIVNHKNFNEKVVLIVLKNRLPLYSNITDNNYNINYIHDIIDNWYNDNNNNNNNNMIQLIIILMITIVIYMIKVILKMKTKIFIKMIILSMIMINNNLLHDFLCSWTPGFGLGTSIRLVWSNLIQIMI